MKKRTLISTLAMVVIVALALTTATFAWYTANNQVTAKSSATAATASASSLVISDTTTFAMGNTSTTIEGGTGLMPMMPKSDWSATAPASFAAAKADMNGAIRANGSFDTSTTYTDKYFAGTFYVKNDAATGGQDVSLSIELTNGTIIDGENETDGDETALNMLRVAIFVKGADDSETFVGVLRTGGTVSFVDVAATDASESGTTFTVANKVAGSFDEIATVAPQAYVTINFIAWYEGSALTQDNSGAVATFNLVVDGEAVTTPAP